MNLRRISLLPLAVLSLSAGPAYANESAPTGPACESSECVMMGSQGEAGARLALAVAPDRRHAHPGSRVALRLAISNESDAVAREVEVCSQLPLPVTVETLFSGAQWRGNAVCWELGDLAAGQRVERRLRPRIDDDARPQLLTTLASAEGANALLVRDKAQVRVRRARAARRTL